MGIGERRAVRDTDVMSGNVKLALSHVVPDLVVKVLKGQDPLHILGEGNQVRHYTYGGDLAHGIRLAMESQDAVNNDFNLSTAASTTVLELAEAIWRKVRGDGEPLRYVTDPPFEHDVQLRVPDVRKARDVLGFEATTTLDAMLDEVVPWIRAEERGGAPVTRLLPELYEAGSTSGGQRQGRRLARDRRGSSSATSTPMRRARPCLRPGPFRPVGHGAASAGRRISGTCARRCRRTSGSSRRRASTSPARCRPVISARSS